MIRAVVFDVGGTMHVTHPDVPLREAFSKKVMNILADSGISIEMEPGTFYASLQHHAEEYKAWSEESGKELPTEDIWADYYLKPFLPDKEKLKPVSETLSYLYDAERSLIVPRPALLETIQALHGMGLVTGVISNITSLTFVPRMLDRYGITDYMSCVVLSSASGIRKPRAGIFRVAEKELGLPPEQLAYVGDTISRDVIGTRNAGWRLMIQIENPLTVFRDQKVKDSAYKPDYLISRLDEIPAIIERENKKKPKEGTT